MTNGRNITLDEFLEMEEINRAWEIWINDRANFHRRVRDEIITPNMDRINKALGQDNSSDYLAYAVEFVFGQIGGKTP